MLNIYNPNTQEAEAERACIWGYPGVHSNSLSHKKFNLAFGLELYQDRCCPACLASKTAYRILNACSIPGTVHKIGCVLFTFPLLSH